MDCVYELAIHLYIFDIETFKRNDANAYRTNAGKVNRELVCHRLCLTNFVESVKKSENIQMCAILHRL